MIRYQPLIKGRIIMKFDAQKALIAYSGVLTAVFVGVMVSGAVSGAGPARFTEIDVQRINVREPDGTLRMVISNQTAFPEIPYRGRGSHIRAGTRPGCCS
ncbi:hypothetical protein D3C73_117870 [compost metagenome]